MHLVGPYYAAISWCTVHRMSKVCTPFTALPHFWLKTLHTPVLNDPYCCACLCLSNRYVIVVTTIWRNLQLSHILYW